MSRPKMETVKIRELLGKYDLNSPIPEADRSMISSRMGPVFKKVLKGSGKYSVLYGLFLWLYFFFKRFGITITVGKILVTFIISASVITGGYFLYFYLIDRGKPVNQAVDYFPAKVNYSEKRVESRRKKAIVKYVLSVHPFTSSSVGKNIVKGAPLRMSVKLNEIMGSHYCIYSGDVHDSGAKYALLGNIEMVEGAIILFVKIIDVKNSSIVYAVKEKAGSADMLDEAFGRIAGRVSEKIR